MIPWGMLADMASRLGTGTAGPSAIGWACPVPYFGRAGSAKVATVGLNPSNQEFCRPDGTPLTDHQARFPTLGSLRLETWLSATHRETAAVATACDKYFLHRPYDRWFGVLDSVLRPGGFSYRSPTAPACHLDLTPFATADKWGRLPAAERNDLLAIGSPWFRQLLIDTCVTVLALNGAAVARAVGQALGLDLEGRDADDLHLPRRDGTVPGRWYDATITRVDGHPLGRDLRIVGWNYNLQSSFGVTTQARNAVARRLTEVLEFL